MKIRKLTTISAICIIMIVTSSTTFASDNSKVTVSSELPDSYTIQDVPYIDQETGFFCQFASLSMLFQYYNRSASLREVLYYCGTGHSFCYSSNERLPALANAFKSSVLEKLYGVSFREWMPDLFMSEDECWQEYWYRVKQNISNDIPVLTTVDPFSLSSAKNQFNLPVWYWNMHPPSGHVILLIGYNESNETVCYHDSIAESYGDSQYGVYAWMSLDDFKKALKRDVFTSYLIWTFKRVSSPLPPEEIFDMAHKENIERLKGNLSAYTKWFVDGHKDYDFGINASKELREDFKKGIGCRHRTIFTYKLKGKLGLKYRLKKFLLLSHLPIFDLFPVNFTVALQTGNVYTQIAIQKRYTAEYLREIQLKLSDPVFLSICINESNLFEQEAENWTKLAECYSEFKEKGIFMSLSHGIQIMIQMEEIMDNVVTIQQKIIDGPLNGK